MDSIFNYHFNNSYMSMNKCIIINNIFIIIKENYLVKHLT